MANATKHSSKLSAEDVRVIRRTQWSHSGNFSADDLINAYLMGKERGRTESKKTKGDERLAALVDQLRVHVGQALDESERFYLDVRSQHGIDPVAVYLRVVSIWPFEAEALYLVPLDVFISDVILEVYESAASRSADIRKAEDDETKCFDLEFHFMPEKPSTDRDAIQTDFEFRYEREQEPDAS